MHPMKYESVKGAPKQAEIGCSLTLTALLLLWKLSLGGTITKKAALIVTQAYLFWPLCCSLPLISRSRELHQILDELVVKVKLRLKEKKGNTISGCAL